MSAFQFQHDTIRLEKFFSHVLLQWPKAVQKLASSYLKSPITISIGKSASQLTVNKDVTQVFYDVKNDEKEDKLLETLSAIESP